MKIGYIGLGNMGVEKIANAVQLGDKVAINSEMVATFERKLKWV